MRLDCFLHTQGLTQSRQKAQELIKSGVVWVGHKQILKSSYEVEDQEVRIETCKKQWVARSGKSSMVFSPLVGLQSKIKQS